MPPKPRIKRQKCPRGSYYKPGRYFWRNGRWVWKSGGCKAIPGAYRKKVGCRYVRGGWKRLPSGRVVWKKGGFKCRKVVAKHPTRRPPAPRIKRKKCPRGSYYKPGRYFWRNGRWVWKSGGCKAIPRRYRRRRKCRYVRGGWKRLPSGRVVWKKGGWKCGRALRRPSRMPPRRRVKRKKCPRGSYFKAGRYFWRNGRWVWKSGGCKAIPRRYRRRKRCRFVRGGWKRLPSGRVVWKKGGWKCRK
jgi:hypothetical protein